MNATTVSVVIPSAGHAESLRRCLESLRIQAIEGGLEVIVVLDGATASRAEGVGQLRAREDWPWPLRWIEIAGPRGPAAARNRGIAEAGGRYLIFVDDDMVLAPDFVAEHLKMLAENPGSAIIGAIITRLIGYGGAYRGWVEGFWSQRHERLTREPRTNFFECFTGNLALAAADARRVGGFDESIATCEDVEFGLRLERAGVRLQYGARALATQLFRKSASQYMRDGVVRGGVTATLWRKYPESRRAVTFAVPQQGALGTRWLRRRALASRWRWEAMGAALPWLPDITLTQLLGGFLYNLAAARGARHEFADEDQWSALSEGTVVLCYRGFRAAGAKRPRHAIARERFARQLEELVAAGYRFVTLRELIEAHERDEVLSGHTAIVTFDDPSTDVVEVAAPILGRMRAPGVLNISRASIGKPGFLTSDQLEMLIGEGWEISWSDSGSRDDAGTSAGYVHLHSPSQNLPRFVIDGRWPMWLFKLKVLHGFISSRSG